jgi:hypothetical protein
VRDGMIVSDKTNVPRTDTAVLEENVPYLAASGL